MKNVFKNTTAIFLIFCALLFCNITPASAANFEVGTYDTTSSDPRPPKEITSGSGEKATWVKASRVQYDWLSGGLVRVVHFYKAEKSGKIFTVEGGEDGIWYGNDTPDVRDLNFFNNNATSVDENGKPTTMNTVGGLQNFDNYKGDYNKDPSNEIWCIKGGVTGFDISMTGCAAKVAYIFLFFASWVLWLTAVVFNLTIDYSLNMAGFLEKVDMVTIGWQTFRDFANLFFIFIILYIAINTIIGNSTYGIKSLLGKVIVAAILINFSLFFTKVIIDTSNIFALQFYTKIIHDSGGKAGQYDTWQEYDGGISAALASAMGMETVWKIGRSAQNSNADEALTTDSAKQLGLNAGNLIIVGFGGGVFLLITAAVFLAGALMFFLRAITLIFLMILSPFAFVGGILPATKGYASKWWNKLFQNAIFAPVYMALMYLVLSMVLDGGKFQGGDFVQIFSGDTGTMDTVITFIILNALMVGCITIAKQLGAQGAGFASNMLATAGTLAGASTFGVMAATGRSVVGRGANWYANKFDEPTNAASRFMHGLARRGASATFDARNIAGVGKKIGIGSSDKSFKKNEEDRIKSLQEESKLYGTAGKIALGESLRDRMWASRSSREASKKILKEGLTEDIAKEQEKIQEWRDNPEYQEFTNLYNRRNSDKFNDKDKQRMKQLFVKLNGETVEYSNFDAGKGKWSKKDSSGEKLKKSLLSGKIDANGNLDLDSDMGDMVKYHAMQRFEAQKYVRSKKYEKKI